MMPVQSRLPSALTVPRFSPTDPFGRPTSFASLAALSNGAFGGLGSPTFSECWSGWGGLGWGLGQWVAVLRQGAGRVPEWALPRLAPTIFCSVLCLDSGAVFAQKESPGAPPAFASPPDPWGRLHRSPLAFPAWVRPPEAARTPGSDKERPVERREPSLTKEEKDRCGFTRSPPAQPSACRPPSI